MKFEGGELKVLKTLFDLQRDPGDYVDDARLAAATKMFVQDVRDLLEKLEGKGLVERYRGIDGFSTCVTAKGKRALSQGQAGSQVENMKVEGGERLVLKTSPLNMQEWPAIPAEPIL